MEYIAGHARFTGPKEVTVGDQVITAKHILIATGTKPMIPNIPGVFFSQFSTCVHRLIVQVLSWGLLVMAFLNWKIYQS